MRGGEQIEYNKQEQMKYSGIVHPHLPVSYMGFLFILYYKPTPDK